MATSTTLTRAGHDESFVELDIFRKKIESTVKSKLFVDILIW